MDYIFIAKAVGAMALLGFAFGLFLDYLSRKFKVEVDPHIQRIYDVLPHADCGACGYPTCMEFAKAVYKGETKTDGCKTGGAKTAAAVAAVMKG